MYNLILTLIVIVTAFHLFKKSFMLSTKHELTYSHIANNDRLNVVPKNVPGEKEEISQYQYRFGAPESFLMAVSRKGIELIASIRQCLDSNANIAISGETGTCKEEIVQYLHKNSLRNGKPLVFVGCPMIPSALIESELFGHKAGAFAGAFEDKTGKLEMADGGTIVLDDFFDLSSLDQNKILRAISEKSFSPIGSSECVQFNARIIFTTDQELEFLATKNPYEVIGALSIEIPPLRDRMEDIPIIINELVRCAEEENLGVVRFSTNAILSLCRYGWPGNERELTNFVQHRAVVNSDDVVDVGDLPDEYTHRYNYTSDLKGHLSSLEGTSLEDYLHDLEEEMIKKALEESQRSNKRASNGFD